MEDKKILSNIPTKQSRRKYIFQSFLSLLLIALTNLITIESFRDLKNSYSEIHLTIQGNGLQSLLSNYSQFDPPWL